MPLGLCCHYVEERKPGVLTNLFDTRTLQLGRWQRGEYSEERVRNTYLHNARSMLKVIPLVVASGVRHLRFSCDLIPLGDKVPREWWDNNELRSAYKAIGDYCRAHGVRPSCHPGQFCVLNSRRDDVIANAIEEMSRHAWVFDACEFPMSPEASINIHAGCKDEFAKLVSSITSLPHFIRTRLTLENDENVASVSDLVHVNTSVGVPIVFDSHHHTFNDGNDTMQQAYDAAMRTWPANIMPVQHISNTEPALENGSRLDRRKHSFFIQSIPEPQLEGIRRREIALEVECKSKNLGISKMVADFDLRNYI